MSDLDFKIHVKAVSGEKKTVKPFENKESAEYFAKILKDHRLVEYANVIVDH